MKISSISNSYSYNRSFGTQANTDMSEKKEKTAELLGDCCLMLGVPFLLFDTFEDGFDVKPKSKWGKFGSAAIGITFLAVGYKYIKNEVLKKNK